MYNLSLLDIDKLVYVIAIKIEQVNNFEKNMLLILSYLTLKNHEK